MDDRGVVVLTRRAFVTRLGAAIAMVQVSGVASLVSSASPVGAQVPTDDTLNALLAFVVPGPDSFSAAQGVADPQPGGVDAGVLAALAETLDNAAPSPQPPLTTSQFVVVLLDQVAAGVNPAAQGFAGLSFGEKMGAFAFLESDPLAAPLAAALLAVTANLVYSEAGVFDPSTRTLTGRPLGWDLTGYPGVSDGRDEFVGYYRNRRKAS